MKTTPTVLMKELKYIEQEIKDLLDTEREESSVPLNDKLEPKYSNNYIYDVTRNKCNELRSRELEIRSTLAKFNSQVKVIGRDITVQEALVKISQLQADISILKNLASRSEYYEVKNFNNEPKTYKTMYDINRVKEDARTALRELSSLQIDVDKTNLTTFIEV